MGWKQQVSYSGSCLWLITHGTAFCVLSPPKHNVGFPDRDREGKRFSLLPHSPSGFLEIKRHLTKPCGGVCL